MPASDEKNKESQEITPELILKAMGYKRVQKMGGNQMVIVPKMWLRLNGYQINDNYWIRITSEKDGTLVLKPANKEDITNMMEVNQCQV